LATLVVLLGQGFLMLFAQKNPGSHPKMQSAIVLAPGREYEVSGHCVIVPPLQYEFALHVKQTVSYIPHRDVMYVPG
jgi:hypothetical protein